MFSLNQDRIKVSCMHFPEKTLFIERMADYDCALPLIYVLNNYKIAGKFNILVILSVTL